jgi:hypothetical protein
MSNKCEEEFNPWPSFVDIFSSVILVMLLFLLVVLVNLGYYAQFKYKLSYTGSISSADLILNDNPSEVKLKEIVKESTVGKTVAETVQKKQPAEKVVILQKEIIRLRRIIEERTVKAKEKKEAKIEAGGIDVANRKDDDKKSKQTIITADEYFIITFKGNEIFFDNEITKKLKVFIKKLKSKYKKHTIKIIASDVKGQASATIAKQISLARSLGARNLIRKLGYDKKNVRVDLLGSAKVKEKINEENGYLIVRIKR